MSCAAVVWGLGSLPEVAPSWVLEGLGVGRPQTPATAVLYALNTPCQPPGKVWVIYNQKYMDS